MDDAVRELLNARHRQLDEYLARCFARYADAPPRLIEAVRYSVDAGGKRLRPALVLTCFDVARAANAVERPAHPPSALAAAAALELIHTFSLVHDDLPAMDDDDLRRGRPTNHKVYGEALAILAGDAVMTIAFDVLATDAEPSLVGPLVRELAHAAGPAGMIGGQVLDMDGESRVLPVDELRHVHALKTGALLTAACRVGAIAAGAGPQHLDAMTRFGGRLGLAFQIVDDLLDVTGTPERLGKATNKDADRGKNTYPALLGLDGARAAADEQTAAALNALDAFGPPADPLRALANFVLRRDR